MASDKLSLDTRIPFGLTSEFHSIPCVGLGVWQTPRTRTRDISLSAIQNGYRHIDCAKLYRNEAEVGEAVAASDIPREALFITTKVRQVRATPQANDLYVQESFDKIPGGVDLFLVHAPPATADGRREIWRALERLAHLHPRMAIGVSNYGFCHLEEMRGYAKTWPPAVNQLELHPWCQQRALVAYCKEQGILIQAYSPLARGRGLKDNTVVAMADKYNKSTAQILIRYSIQKEWIPLPKSSDPGRVRDNGNVFDFSIEEVDMAMLDALDQGREGALLPQNVHEGGIERDCGSQTSPSCRRIL